ncbi:MAG: hypothetical protein F2796_06890, partial [Actinobacteria bacterium]|nr:hypothetical protein [Actinomycetota bacterium]
MSGPSSSCAPGSMQRSIVAIINPHASRFDARAARSVFGTLAGQFHVETVETQARGHATQLADAAARSGADLVVTFGGDGTLNEAVNGLADHDVPVFPLPGGSQNVFAKLLGIPANLDDAAQDLLWRARDWQVRRVDAGRVNGRRFTFSAGVGLDAAVVERVD